MRWEDQRQFNKQQNPKINYKVYLVHICIRRNVNCECRHRSTDSTYSRWKQTKKENAFTIIRRQRKWCSMAKDEMKIKRKEIKIQESTTHISGNWLRKKNLNMFCELCCCCGYKTSQAIFRYISSLVSSYRFPKIKRKPRDTQVCLYYFINLQICFDWIRNSTWNCDRR